MERRRFKQTTTLKERMVLEAERLRKEAEAVPFGSERDALLRKARQADTAAHMDEWLSSAELKPPE